MLDAHYESIWCTTQENFDKKFKDNYILGGTGTLTFINNLEYNLGSNTLQIPKESIKGITIKHMSDMGRKLVILFLISFSAFSFSTNLPSSGTLFFVIALMLIFLETHSNWIQIQYINSGGQEKIIYFFVGTYMGFGGAFGGTARLCNELLQWKNSI
jgi:hypothetical protein